jgi:hypothetical protein
VVFWKPASFRAATSQSGFKSGHSNEELMMNELVSITLQIPSAPIPQKKTANSPDGRLTGTSTIKGRQLTKRNNRANISHGRYKRQLSLQMLR